MVRVLRRLSVAAFLVLGSTCAFAQGDVELEAFLSTPLPADPISVDLARSTVEKGAALAASAGARGEEVRAYLIPFQRVLETPAPVAPVPAKVPVAKPFLIFRSSEAGAECFKAASVVTQGEFMLAQSIDGKKGMWQKSRYAAQLPWYFKEEMESGSIDLETLALRYKSLESTFPTLKGVLHAEMESIQAINRKIIDAANLKRAAIVTQAQEIIANAQSYSQDHDYSRQELAAILLKAEEVRTKLPDFAARIDAALAPFRAHFQNLLANRVFFEGAWQPKELVADMFARKKEAEEMESYGKALHFEVNAQTVSGPEMRRVLMLLGAVALVVFLIGLFLLIGQSALPLRALGILLCMAPASLWIYGNFRLSAPYPKGPSFETEKSGGSEKLLRVLHLSATKRGATVSEVDRKITLREADVNSFVKERTKFVGAPRQNDEGIIRTDLAFQFLPGEVIVWELSNYRGRPLRVRYGFILEGIGSEVKLGASSIAIGSVALPGLLAKPIIESLVADLEKAIISQGVDKAYALTRLTDGELDLTSKTPAAAPAKPEKQAPAVTAQPSAQPSAVPAASPKEEAVATPSPVQLVPEAEAPATGAE